MDSLALRIAEHPHSAKFAPTNAAPPPGTVAGTHLVERLASVLDVSCLDPNEMHSLCSTICRRPIQVSYKC